MKLFENALAKRASLLTDHTNAIRWVDGEGDGIPGVYLESYADRWLLSTSGSVVDPKLRSWIAARGWNCAWKRLDQHQKESPAPWLGEIPDQPFEIRENGIKYEISFHAGYSQGIFLDQRDNRAAVRARVKPGMKLLNTFAYTGGFSVSAAMAGAETTTLDLSQPYLDWARRNFQLNGLDSNAHHYCKGDTFHWLRRFAKQGRKFDAIVLDPPTFSRDENGKVFRVEQHFGELAALAASVLAKDGWMLCCTNYRGMTSMDFERLVKSGFTRAMKAEHAEMPVDFTAPAYLKSLWLGGF
jgi:23S rRNA (cytosine1962-C5)-methyltransferase